MYKPGTTSSALIAAALLSALASCQVEQPPTVFGLDAIHMDVDSDDIAKLRSGTFTKTRVPVEVEMFGQTRSGTISVAGRSTVDDLKKSFNLDFDSALGKHRRYRINAMSRDPSATRGYVAWYIYSGAGFVTPELSYVTVFLNGDYLGLFLFHETIDEDFFTERGLEPVSIYAAHDTLATMEKSADVELAFSSRIGPDLYGDLKELVAIINQPASEENRAELARYLDVDSVLTYMAATVFSDNRDGVDNNFVLYRTEQDPRFAILPWDLDLSLRFVNNADDGAVLLGRNAMMRRFFDDPKLRERYDCLLAALNEANTAALLNARLYEIIAQTSEAWAADLILGPHPEPLRDQVAAIAQRNVAQQASLANLPPCSRSD